MELKKLIYYLFILLVFGCEQETSWENKNIREGTIVVDAIITDENKPQQIKLYYSNTNINEDITYVENAVVFINQENNMKFETFYKGNGVYETVNNFIPLINTNYKLEIIINSDTITGIDHLEAVTPLINYKPELDVETGWYKLPDIQENAASKVEYFISWGHLGYTENNTAKIIQYTLFNFDLNVQFQARTEEVYFPPGSIIIRKKYSLSVAHQEFLRSLLLETEWRGGLFDVEHGELRTNMSEGATGFFGVSAVLTDTLVVE